MTTLKRGRRYLRAVEDLIFPPVCAGCRRRGHWLCPACQSSVKPLRTVWCLRCGSSQRPGQLDCRACADLQRAPAVCFAAHGFEGPLRESIHRLKYQGEHARAEFHVQLLLSAAEACGLDLTSWDGVVGVPLHSRRRRQRGYDQAGLLAERLADLVGLQVRSGLARVVDTPSQVGLDLASRRTNVAAAFAWRAGTPPPGGQSLLLIDDVVTTGSTLLSAADALLSAGASRVLALALARGG